MARLSPILFEVSRLLAVVPALCGVLWCAWHFFLEPNSSNAVYKGDYVVAALWVRPLPLPPSIPLFHHQLTSPPATLPGPLNSAPIPPNDDRPPHPLVNLLPPPLHPHPPPRSPTRYMLARNALHIKRVECG